MRGSTQLQLLQFDSLSDIARNHGEDGAAWMTAMLAPKRNVLHVWASH